MFFVIKWESLFFTMIKYPCDFMKTLIYQNRITQIQTKYNFFIILSIIYISKLLNILVFT